ncbi:olfactory receptor 6P1-like [Pelobates fuscus]|uniref:olfactory receptor 6P1-like n=1 Tax=Pelobates fuscus TaxID=191477 RepID=UPI002FE48A1D
MGNSPKKKEGLNYTLVTEFLLLGFQNCQIFNIMLFMLFLAIYILTLNVNLLIIVLVGNAPNLNSPMYFFLSQLSLSDILLTTNITPNLLHIIINAGSKISFEGCITQFYFHGALNAVECLLLTVMSYDRYLAICDPLVYTSTMEPRHCLKLVLCSWFSGFMAMLIFVFLLCHLQFCGPYVIDHYFCDLGPLLELSCSDYTFLKITQFALAIPFALVPFLCIFSTYLKIIITIIGIASTNRKQKAFSTCSSHLIVVCMYYGILTIVYIVPSKGQSFNINKILSILYTIGIPFFNPIIYSLRNQEIRTAKH